MDILLTVLVFAPFIAVLWLANMADRKGAAGKYTVYKGQGQARTLLSFIAIALVALFYAFMIAAGVVIQGSALLMQSAPAGPFSDALNQAGLTPGTLSRVGMAIWLPAALGILLLLPPVRRLVAHLIPINPASVVHTVALSFPAIILANLLFTLGWGLDNLAKMMEASTASGVAFNPAGPVWAQDITMFAMAMVGVGWLSRKDFRSTLLRLGIVAPARRQALVGLGTGLVLVPLILVFERLAGQVGLGVSPDVEKLTEQLIGPLTMSIPGILTLGLAAALGEESVFRGAMQPVFGLLLTSVLFALLHSQYGISLASLLVLIVGLVLGLLRLRYNTSTSMIAHATYNMTLGMLSYLGMMQKL